MTFQKLAKELTRLEGKKRQVNIAQMSEVLKSLRILIAKNPGTVLSTLLKGIK